MKKERRGFTIVEMLAVIGVIAILASIIVSVASSSIKSARSKRADAMCNSLQQAIAAYYAQEGKWPGSIEGETDSAAEGRDTKKFEGTQADKIFQEVVGKGYGRGGKKSMLVDVSALFVCESGAANNKRARGYNFSEVTGSGAKHRIGLNQMAFGYQDEGSGYFRRFEVEYKYRTDTVKVKKQE